MEPVRLYLQEKESSSRRHADDGAGSQQARVSGSSIALMPRGSRSRREASFEGRGVASQPSRWRGLR